MLNIAYITDGAKIIAAFCRISYCLLDLIRYNSIVCHVQTNKMCGDAVFANRFHYQLTMFGMRVLIWLSRLVHAHIAYEIDTDKIIAAFCRISYCLHDFTQLHSIVGDVQTTRCTMIWFSMIDSDIN